MQAEQDHQRSELRAIRETMEELRRILLGGGTREKSDGAAPQGQIEPAKRVTEYKDRGKGEEGA